MSTDIPAALRELRRALRKLEELSEWHKLAQQERRPSVPPGFQPEDHTQDDIQVYSSSFIAIMMDTREALKSSARNVSKRQQRSWTQRLRQLEERFQKLYDTVSFSGV